VINLYFSIVLEKTFLMQQLAYFIKLIEKEVPLKIKYKNEAWEMKCLNSLIKWFNPTFMEDYTTVIGYTVYFTGREYVESQPKEALQTLVHEAVHLLDTKHWGFPIFAFAYLFPQILALGVFLFPISSYFLFCLVFLLPFPAPFRAYFEARAYATDLILKRRSIDQIVAFFTSLDYYKMYPFENQVEKTLRYWSENPDERIKKVIDTYKDAISSPAPPLD
jgi:hypothetical protein